MNSSYISQLTNQKDIDIEKSYNLDKLKTKYIIFK